MRIDNNRRTPHRALAPRAMTESTPSYNAQPAAPHATSASAGIAPSRVVFVGGGNMARAILGGLRASMPASALVVIEPHEATRSALAQDFGVRVFDSLTPTSAPAADLIDLLQSADALVWAVKPQSFALAAAPLKGRCKEALHLSVMAGVRCSAIERATGAKRIVRAMPNTPALIGRGVVALVATASVDAQGRSLAEQVMAPTGQWLWLDDEVKLDAVTALSGSGPAYHFYFLEAMVAAGVRLGLSAADAKVLAVATAQGSAELAARSPDSLATLRERVTSKGGTTHAALTVLGEREVAQAIDAALAAATQRAKELGDLLES
jgi:pyrroline-5-carboxylate reductase